MRLLKQSTTVTIQMGPALDKTDGVTEETALSPTVEISKAGGAFAARNSATAITHDQNGWYRVELNATDTNTVGPLIAKFDDAATHLPVWHEFIIVPANVYDSLVGGSDNLQVDTVQVGGTTQTAGDIIGDTNDIQARLPAALVSGRIDASLGAIAAGVDLSATMKTSVKSEVVNALNVDTYAEPGQGNPPASATLVQKIGYLYKAWRNRHTQTSTQYKLYADDATTVDQKASFSDDGTTADRGEIATGP